MLMGARVSSGPGSKQDYETPVKFMEAVVRHFGPLAFDLAARSCNAKSPHYFAPCTGPEGPLPVDPAAYAMDAFDHRWHELSKPDTWRDYPPGRRGLLWLNCEFNDIPSWAERCRVESAMGAEILLLTPAAVGSNWFSELVAGYADVYLLKGRLSFIPGQPYNKDCMLSHYRPRATLLWSEKLENRKICVWDWKCDRILYEWSVQ